MSMIRDGFRSLYRSGAYFSEAVLPRALERAGVSHAAAAKIGAGAGMALGIASLVVGAAYALAIPLALPMCGVAIAIYGAKGVAMAAGLVSILASTSGVVMTTALGMCREITHSTSGKLQKAAARLHASPAPEKRSFRQTQQAKLGFRKAVENNAPQKALVQNKQPVQTPWPGLILISSTLGEEGTRRFICAREARVRWESEGTLPGKNRRCSGGTEFPHLPVASQWAPSSPKGEEMLP